MKIFALLTLLVASTCLADIVTLKDGRWVEGTVTSYGGIVKVKCDAGTLVYSRNQVSSIKRTACKTKTKQPCETNFGSEFSTRPKPVAKDYTIAKPSKIIVIPERPLPKYQTSRYYNRPLHNCRRTITYTPKVISSRPVRR